MTTGIQTAVFQFLLDNAENKIITRIPACLRDGTWKLRSETTCLVRNNQKLKINFCAWRYILYLNCHFLLIIVSKTVATYFNRAGIH
jgi:hypothetical protein